MSSSNLDSCLFDLTISDIISLYKSRKISPVDLAKSYIERGKKNQHLNVFVEHFPEEYILNKAKEAEKRYIEGNPLNLDGIFYGIKDLFCTKGIRTTACSKILSNFIPPYESTVTDKLNFHGAIGLGKTNMDEFAMGSANINSYFGPAISPWGANITPGGSSGGSSSAVSAKLCHFAIGSDTGGSIRQPAAYTGIVGIKPTYGRCSRYGMIPFASSLDQAGILARNVKDAALGLQYMMGSDRNDPTCVDLDVPDLTNIGTENPSKLKIGFPRKLLESLKNTSLIEAIDELLKTIELNNFAEIVDIEIPNLEKSVSIYYIIAPAEASSNLAKYDGIRYGYRADSTTDLEDFYSKTRSEGFGAEVKRRILIGNYVLSSSEIDSYFFRAQKIRRMLFDNFKSVFKSVDAILMPTAPNTAFDINRISSDPTELYLNDIFTIPSSLAGIPSISIPIGLDKSNNLPLGVQVICDHFKEEQMIKFAYQIETFLNLKFEPKNNVFN